MDEVEQVRSPLLPSNSTPPLTPPRQQELSSFALIVCDRKGRLRPHLTTSLTLTGSTITFLSELSIAKEFRGMGYGSSALRALWAAEGTGVRPPLFSYPSLPTSLPPQLT